VTQTEQKTRQWIDVNEHLPEEGEEVLVCGYFRAVFGKTCVMLAEATFSPSQGWESSLSEIHYWTEKIELPLKIIKED
jgi:hypothetical protein